HHLVRNRLYRLHIFHTHLVSIPVYTTYIPSLLYPHWIVVNNSVFMFSANFGFTFAANVKFFVHMFVLVILKNCFHNAEMLITLIENSIGFPTVFTCPKS